MAPEYVSSNVMNFLVWKYLDEAGQPPFIVARTVTDKTEGYHKAADRLKRSWIGHNDPGEVIPFAPRIQRNALISLVQDGLFLDNLESEVKNASQLKASSCFYLTLRRRAHGTLSATTTVRSTPSKPTKCVSQSRSDAD